MIGLEPGLTASLLGRGALHCS